MTEKTAEVLCDVAKQRANISEGAPYIRSFKCNTLCSLGRDGDNLTLQVIPVDLRCDGIAFSIVRCYDIRGGWLPAKRDPKVISIPENIKLETPHA
jgi:hypothetical protein